MLVLCAALALPCSADVDRDGQSRIAGDCDDGDAGANSFAVEVCNGRDDDCDGSLDEGCATTCPGDGPPSLMTVIDGDSTWSERVRLAVGRTQLVASAHALGGATGAGAWIFRLGVRGERISSALLDGDGDGTVAIDLATRGDGAGAVWASRLGGSTCRHQQLSENLVAVAAPTTLSAAGRACLEVHVAWSGAVFGNIWVEKEPTQDRLVFAPHPPAPSALGTKRTMNTAGSRVKSAAIAARGTAFGVAWFESQGGTTTLVHGEINELSVPLRAPRNVLVVGSTARGLDLLWMGDRYVVAWSEAIGGAEEVRAVEVDTSGVPAGPPEVLSIDDTLDSALPDLTWTGTRLIVSWIELEAPLAHVEVARLSTGLAREGDVLGVDPAGGEQGPPAIRWTGDTLVVVRSPGGDGGLVSTAVGCVDADGDGAAARISDCDDGDPMRYPGSQETCDGIDQDCNLEPDDGCRDCPDPQALAAISFDQVWTPRGAPTRIRTAWTGSVFGVTWLERGPGPFEQLLFRTVDKRGVPQSETRALTTGETEAFLGHLIWTGRRFAVTWGDSEGYLPGQGNEVLFQLLNLDGSAASSRLNVSEMGVGFPSYDYQAVTPTLVWNGSGFLVAWADHRDEVTLTEIYTRLLSAEGQPLAPPVRSTAYPDSARRPSLAWSGDSYGLGFDLGNRTFFRLLGPDGRPLTESRFIDLGSREPSVVWVGTQYAVGYLGEPTECNIDPCPMLVLVDANGIPAPAPLQLGGGYSTSLDVVWSGAELGASWFEQDPFVPREQFRLARVAMPAGSLLGIVDVERPAGGILENQAPLAWTGDAYSLLWRWVESEGVPPHAYRTAIRCCRDLDLDGVSLCADCDDADPLRAPGLAEICDRIDNDCDLLVDEGAGPPGAARGLRFNSDSSLLWDVVVGADTYDVVRGGVASLMGSAGDFAQSIGRCIAADANTTQASDAEWPQSGDAFYYLVRATGCGEQSGSYDEAAGGQVGGRDGEIGSAPAACP